MTRVRILPAALVLGLLILGISVVFASDEAPARGVILMIGDGMGPEIVSIVNIYAEKSLGTRLNMVELANSGITGYVTTHSEDKLITDSAASGTAMAAGVKTGNGIVGMTGEGEFLRNIFERATEKGKAVGVVTTTSVTDATPAAFLAHSPSREMHFDIASQIVEGNASVILGGGYWFFLPPERGKRPDGVDLGKKARDKGFDVVLSRQDLMTSAGQRVLGLFAPECLPYERDRDNSKIPSLSEMVLKAIDVLDDDPDGFVLMVEGGRIDHAEHENSIADAIADFLAFDEAIGAVMTHQETDSSLTVVVTADHDCGGGAITGTSYGYPSYGDLDKIAEGKSRYLRWVSGQHTGTMVPVFARGPGAERFSGIQDNTEIHDDLVEILGL